MAEGIVQVTEGSGKKLHTWDRTIGANLVQDELVLHSEPHLASYVVSTLPSPSTATANSHLLQIMAGASLTVFVRSIRITQITLATTAAIVSLQLFRLTTAGTGGTALTPSPLDTTDAAAGATAMTLPTVKGTEGVVLGAQAVQFIQTVTTGGPGRSPLLCEWTFDNLKSKALRIPAGTANGLAVKLPTAVAAGAVTIEAVISEAPAGY